MIKSIIVAGICTKCKVYTNCIPTRTEGNKDKILICESCRGKMIK